MYVSWKQAMAAFAAQVHPLGRAIIVNDHVTRADLMLNVGASVYPPKVLPP